MNPTAYIVFLVVAVGIAGFGSGKWLAESRCDAASHEKHAVHLGAMSLQCTEKGCPMVVVFDSTKALPLFDGIDIRSDEACGYDIGIAVVSAEDAATVLGHAETEVPE